MRLQSAARRLFALGASRHSHDLGTAGAGKPALHTRGRRPFMFSAAGRAQARDRQSRSRIELGSQTAQTEGNFRRGA